VIAAASDFAALRIIDLNDVRWRRCGVRDAAHGDARHAAPHPIRRRHYRGIIGNECNPMQPKTNPRRLLFGGGGGDCGFACARDNVREHRTAMERI